MKSLNISVVFCAIATLLLLSCSCRREAAKSDDVKAEDTHAMIISRTLSNQRINAIAEDSHGRIWLGTFRGLNRWNAADYHQYFCTEDSTSLPDNQILSIFNDSKGRLWISTLAGVALLTDQDDFMRIKSDDNKSHSAKILEGPDGNVYMASASAISKFDPETQSFKTCLPLLQPDSPFGQECIIDKYGNMILVSKESLEVYDTQNFRLIDSLSLGYAPSAMWLEPRNSHLWIAGQGKIEVLDSYTRKKLPTPPAISQNEALKKTHITIIHPWSSNVILFNSYTDGLFAYDQIAAKVMHHSDWDFPFEVPEFNINALFTDSKDNLWIGSYDHGFEVRHSGHKQFNNDNALHLLAGNKSVLGVAADDNNCIWICLLKGELLRYDTQHGTSHKVMLSSPSGLINPAAWSMHVDAKGQVWIASLTTNKVYRCRQTDENLAVMNAYDVDRPLTLAENKDGSILVSTGSGSLVSISSDGLSLCCINDIIGKTGFITDMVHIDDDNILAVSFGQPLYKLNAHTLEAAMADIDYDQWNQLFGNSTFIPTALYKDHHGLIWIGTLGKGLLCYDIEAKTITAKSGLPCSDIAAIQEDRQGNLWISTQNGLSKYDRTTDRFSNFFESDGTGGNQFYDRAACILKDGTLIFGGTHGLTVFNPIDVGNKRTVPVVFEDLKIHNQLVSPALQPDIIDHQLSYSPDIHLNHKQNGFSISFAALDYSGQESVHYFYKLEGFDNYWIETYNREAYYADLDPGDYTFRVRIANSNNSIVSAENAINIHLKAAPWLQWWAIAIYILLFATVAWAIWRLWTRLLKQRAEAKKALFEKEQEKRVNHMNMSFFANISHEFRTPLTMIAGPLNQLKESTSLSSADRNLLQITRHSVDRMLRLVNQLMDFNKLENDTLRLQVDRANVVEYLKAMVNVFIFNAANKGITLTTHGLEEGYTSLVDCDKLEKIVSNLLGNAIKFTPNGGAIELAFDVVAADSVKVPEGVVAPQGACMKITVSDTGPGIPPELRQRIFDRYFQIDKQTKGDCNWGTGIGLYYVKALTLLHHGCIFVSGRDDEGSGAVFTVLLPAADSAYRDDEHATVPNEAPKVSELEESISTLGEATEETTDKPQILVVDDDSEVLNYISTLLSGAYSVLTASDAESALQKIADNNPALVISDVVMPGINGYELCRQIKDDPQICHIPVILVTAKTAIESQVEGLNTGADAYVTKPFDPKYLLALVKSQLGNRCRLQDQLSKSTVVEKIEPEALSATDKSFMDSLYNLMEAELSNCELDINSITEKLSISRTKFYYKVKGLTGTSPATFFKTYKLNRGAELLSSGKYTVSEIADMTGFSTLAHFSTSFKKHFGVSPTSWRPA